MRKIGISIPARVKSMIYKIDTCSFLGLALITNRLGQGLVKFNVREMLLSGLLGHVPVELLYEATISAHSQVGTHRDMILDVNKK